MTETELRQKYNVYLLQLFCCDMDEAIDSEFVSYEEFKRRVTNEPC